MQREYKDRLEKTVLAFSEQGLNSLPYYENKDFGRIVSLVPTSAHTGEGVPVRSCRPLLTELTMCRTCSCSSSSSPKRR